MANRILCKGNVLFLYGRGARSLQKQASNGVVSCVRQGRTYSSSLNEDEDLDLEAIAGSQLLPPPTAMAPPPPQPQQLAPQKPTEDPASPWLDIKVGICGPEGFLPGMVNIPPEIWQPNLSGRGGLNFEFLSKTMMADVGLQRDTFGKEIIHENSEDRVDRVLVDFLRSQKESKTDASTFFFSNQLEFRVQKCPRLLTKDVNRLLPGWGRLPITAITISQRASQDMARWSDDMEEEREQLMAAFVEKAKSICLSLADKGHLADFVDPSSGKAHLSEGGAGTLFPDDERFIHLGFTIEDLGCCRVMNHNVYGTNVFVGVVFSTADPDNTVLQSVLKKAFEDPNDTRITNVDL